MSDEQRNRSKRIRGVLVDLCGIAGAGLVVGGLWLWSIPVAMVVAGVMLLAVAVTGARSWV